MDTPLVSRAFGARRLELPAGIGGRSANPPKTPGMPAAVGCPATAIQGFAAACKLPLPMRQPGRRYVPGSVCLIGPPIVEG